jgi:hypothetical protein
LKAEYFNNPQSNRYSLVLLSVPHAGPLTRTHNSGFTERGVL